MLICMRYLISFVLILLLPLIASAGKKDPKEKQFKKDIATVKTNLKKSTSLETSETTLRKYLADSTFSQRQDVHLMLLECLRKQYDTYNEKMYLKQQIDTTKVVYATLKLFLAAEAFDSLAVRQLEDPSAMPAHRKRHAEQLNPLRNNILKGGIYYYKKNKWTDAWTYLDSYLSCRRQPLFSSTPHDTLHNTYASLLATMSAVNMKDTAKTRQYCEEALRDTASREATLLTVTQMFQENNDTAAFVACLKRGVADYPQSEYFLPNLVDYYNAKGQTDDALDVINAALQTDSTNTMFLLALHNEYMLQKKYDDALTVGLNLLTKNDSLPMPNYNVGYVYYMRGKAEMDRKGCTLRQRTKSAQEQYKRCRPYIERYRMLQPEDVAHWQPLLYEVYYNLNMGKEFESLPPLTQ